MARDRVRQVRGGTHVGLPRRCNRLGCIWPDVQRHENNAMPPAEADPTRGFDPQAPPLTEANCVRHQADLSRNEGVSHSRESPWSRYTPPRCGMSRLVYDFAVCGLRASSHFVTPFQVISGYFRFWTVFATSTRSVPPAIIAAYCRWLPVLDRFCHLHPLRSISRNCTPLHPVAGLRPFCQVHPLLRAPRRARRTRSDQNCVRHG